MNKSTNILLKKYGVPPHVLGYLYIGEAIELIRSDRSILHAITKSLYPTIAKTFNTEATRVERAIRHAKGIAINNLTADEHNELFGKTLKYGEEPTNTHFIAALVEMVDDEEEAE